MLLFSQPRQLEKTFVQTRFNQAILILEYLMDINNFQ